MEHVQIQKICVHAHREEDEDAHHFQITNSKTAFRKAILSAFLLLCSHGKKNDTAMLRKFLRKVLGISLRLRKSLRKVLGIRSTNGW